MTNLKKQAVELLQDIPDDKDIIVVEILKALRTLYNQSIEPAVNNEITPNSVMGICKKYADPALIPLEKDAWGKAVKDKHAAY